LLLNYINSAVALPHVLESPTSLLVATAILATALSAVGLVCGWAIARLLRLTDESRAALMFGLSMKHTGLALILAGVVLREQPLAILIIVLATLMQHLLAGLAQLWLRREWSSGVVE
jgi:predicted Na+-dependent transporter